MVDVCKALKIDSNITGLRYAEEWCLKELAYDTLPLQASGSLTFTGNPANSETITIGGRAYVFLTTLATGPTVANQVLLGTDGAATALNLHAAIMGLAGVGTLYSVGTAPHADVESERNANVLTVRAKTPGAAGNSLALSETTATAITTSGATLEDGKESEPTMPVFHLLEPNSYNDFGGQIATVARNPINPSRQRKKGVTTDLDASGGFEQDLTFSNLTRLLQGFFFADAREKGSTAPLNADRVPVTGVAGNTYTASGGDMPQLAAGMLVRASGFGVTANNGVKTVASVTDTTLVVEETLADEAEPLAGARVDVIGIQFGSDDVNLTKNGDLVELNVTGMDATTLGLIPGEWVFLGGDSLLVAFDLPNVGFARISVIEEGKITFDKVGWSGSVEDAGAGKTVQMFFGTVIRNEPDPLNIIRRTYHIERTLGQDEDGQMSEYLIGAVPNELTLNIPQADKITLGLSFVAVDNEQRTGVQGLKAGVRPASATPEPEDAYNTSSDVTRIKLSMVEDDDAAPDPLFAFATDLTLTINNNVTPNKAIGVLGAFDTSAGTFEVGGNMTAYFANVQAAQAVRNNEDVTMDIVLSKNNRALLFDIPLLSLGDGRLAVEQDEPITIPLETNAAQSKFDHTLLFQSFPYLPNVAS